MEFKTILYKQEDAVAVIQFNRPNDFNAFNTEMLEEMDEVLELIKNDNSVRALVLKGNDEVFAAGADLREFRNYGSIEIRNYIEKAHAMGLKLHRLNKPTIASIAGFCLGGGCELSLSCDMRIAADNSMFGFPEINLGIFPAGGGTQRLARIVGYAVARELILTGDLFNNERALKIGLVNKVVPLNELEQTTMKLARKLSRKPPLAVGMIKELMDLSQHLDPNIGTAIEREKFAVIFASEDKTEGISAFFEGRKPEFKGK